MGSSSGAPPEPIFYSPVEGERPRQGDIVAGLPWGVITNPLMVCRPQGKDGRQGAIHEADKLDSAFKKSGIETLHARGSRGLGMILWPDCQLDKFMNQERPEEKWFAGVAPVRPITALAEDAWPGLRAARRRMYFYVPVNEPLGIPEGFVDFRHIWPVKYALLKTRLAAISDATLASLHAQLYAFFTYQRRKDTTCPQCGTAVSPFESDTGED